MTIKHRWAASLTVWMGALVWCGAAACDAARASPAGAVRDEIATAWREHIEAARRKDLDAVMKIYAPDMVYVVAGEPIRTAERLRESEAAALAGADVLEAVHTSHHVSVHGDLAYEVGSVVGPVRPTGAEARTVRFHFMAQWERQRDGAWRMRYLVGEAEP